MRTFLLTAAAAAVVAAAFTTGAFAQDISSRMIRFGYGLSENSNQGRAVNFFADQVAKLSDGKLKVHGFGDARLGNDIQMQNALIGGAQEMMVGSTATLVGVIKDFGVYDLPFIFSSDKVADAVLDGPFGRKLMDQLKAKGLVALVYWENGFRDLTNNKRPIEKLSDFDGIKLRVMQNPVYIDMFDAFGANAVPMAYSELFTAMQTGAVDGQENPVTTIDSAKFYEVQKYLTISHHVYSPWIVLASKAWWDKLTPDEQKVLQEAAVASRDFERKDSRAATAKSLEFLKSKGMQVNTLSSDVLAQLREKVKPAEDKFAADGGATVLADLKAAVAAAEK